MKRGFTMVEMLAAVVLVGFITGIAFATFHAVSRAWQVSTDYIDKMQRSDYAIDQVVSGLRSMYYPHDGKQNADYGFILVNNGDGDDPDSSDVIEWSKTGPAIVGTKSAVGDTVHRVRVMVLEEGDSDYRDAAGRRIPISVTGLYARQCPDVALRPKDNPDDVDYSFDNEEMYEPVLIADGVVGFNCRVLKTAEEAGGGVRNASANDTKKFEDEYTESNAVPYKVELTFRIADPKGKSYRSNTAPLIRIVRIPIHEQSLDGASTPTEDSKNSTGRKSSGGSSGGGKSSGGGGNRGGGGAGGAGGGGGGR